MARILFSPSTHRMKAKSSCWKPMNCPHHCEIYKTKPRSYRDLPIAWRNSERCIATSRRRTSWPDPRAGFTQDDARYLLRRIRWRKNLWKVIDLVMHVFKSLGFENHTARYRFAIRATRQLHWRRQPVGLSWSRFREAAWARAEDRSRSGGATFYGPKLDLWFVTPSGAAWQLGTIQVDYNLPERFELGT